MPKVVLYCTSVATTLKTKTDITKIKHILDAKRVQYEEVRAADACEALDQFANVWGGQPRAANPLLQVDLTQQPGRREGMLADSGGVKALPQLHIDGKLVGAPRALPPPARARARSGRGCGGR